MRHETYIIHHYRSCRSPFLCRDKGTDSCLGTCCKTKAHRPTKPFFRTRHRPVPLCPDCPKTRGAGRLADDHHGTGLAQDLGNERFGPRTAEAGTLPDTRPAASMPHQHGCPADTHPWLRHLSQQDRTLGRLSDRHFRPRPGLRPARLRHRRDPPARHGTTCLDCSRACLQSGQCQEDG